MVWQHRAAKVHLFSLVTTSVVDRGIMKVIQSLNPPGNRRRETVHATFDDAVQWMEYSRGGPLPGLHAQYQQMTSGQRDVARAR